MKKIALLLTFVTLFSFTFSKEVKNQYSLFTKKADTDVTNLRLGLIYAENKDVSGFDAHLFVSKADSFNGTRIFGLVNMDNKGGDQNSFFNGVNYSKGDVNGVSIFSFVNINNSHDGFSFSGVNYSAEKSKGTNIGFVNYTKEMVGIQFGIFNYAEELDGYQIGLLNYAKNSDFFFLLPIFNKGSK